jgi:hypothetical protein
MNAYLVVSGIIFAVVAVLHAVRLAKRWPAKIGGADIPQWVSWAGLVVAGALAYWAWRLAVM